MENWENGEYEIILSDDNSVILIIKFKIDGMGKVSYDKPTFG